MTVDIGPNRGIAVEIPLAGRIPQPGPLARSYKQRVMVGYRPLPHLGERMPDMPFLPFLSLLKIRCHKEKLVHNKAAKATKICQAAIILVLVLGLEPNVSCLLARRSRWRQVNGQPYQICEHEPEHEFIAATLTRGFGGE